LLSKLQLSHITLYIIYLSPIAVNIPSLKYYYVYSISLHFSINTISLNLGVYIPSLTNCSLYHIFHPSLYIPHLALYIVSLSTIALYILTLSTKAVYKLSLIYRFIYPTSLFVRCIFPKPQPSQHITHLPQTGLYIFFPSHLLRYIFHFSPITVHMLSLTLRYIYTISHTSPHISHLSPNAFIYHHSSIALHDHYSPISIYPFSFTHRCKHHAQKYIYPISPPTHYYTPSLLPFAV